MENLDQLLEIGFKYAGVWRLENEKKLICELADFSGSKNILYAFVCGKTVKYIGKTNQLLQKRMNGYQEPGPTQNTNIRINKRIVDQLSSGSFVQIYAFPDEGFLQFGGYRINLAAGLEDDLVHKLKPEWNALGK